MEEILDLFYLGNYNKVATDAAAIKSTDDEIKFIVLRSRIAIGQIDFVLNATKAKADGMQRGINLLATATRAGSPSEIEKIIPTDDDSDVTSSVFYAICKAIVLLQAKKVDDALTTIYKVNHPEAAALRIQCYLTLNRFDLAKKELEKIENHTLKSVWDANVSLFIDKESINNALLALQDLSDRYQSTPLLSNLISCCFFALGQWESGQMTIQNAAESFPNDDSTAINYAISLYHTDDFEKTKEQMALVNSLHCSYMDQLNEKLQEFDSTVERLAGSE